MLSTFCSPITGISSFSGIAYNYGMEQEIISEFENKSNKQVQPVLILIGGFQGSGKSLLIARIKEIFDINVISTDSIRQSLFDRGLKISPEFSKYVTNIYNNILKKSLTSKSNIIIDANSHSKRVADMEHLLKENNSHYTTIKIFLNTSESTLRDRVRARKPTLGCYQGTESDLEAALCSTKINFEDYDLIVDTDKLSQNDVYETVNDYISPYFNLQSPSINKSIFKSFLINDGDFFSFIERGINKVTQDMSKRAKAETFLDKNWLQQRLEIEHNAITSLDEEMLEPMRRSFLEGIDRSAEHLPFSYNQFTLKTGELVSASKINLSTIDPTCPNMIAAQAPMPGTISRFWWMVFESKSNLIIMLTDLFETNFSVNNIKCTRYFPDNVGETLFLENFGQVSLISNKLIENVDDEELWLSQLHLRAEGEDRIVNHYWLKGWKDGKGLKSLKLHNMLLECIRKNVECNSDNPPIIHCSAGVGRTGTIIGSYLAKHLLVWSPNKKSLVSTNNLPFEITLFLRYQRSHLIHTFDQYMGMHRFIQSIYLKNEG